MGKNSFIVNNEFYENEYKNLCKIFNAHHPDCKEIKLILENKDYFERMKNLVLSDRRGEVVFCVIRPNGKIIAITCEGYPNDIYRIPTGGLGYNEKVLEALFREVKEELGLEVEIVKFSGVLKINFIFENESFMFYSYLFILKELSGVLLKDALDDEISDVKEVSPKELQFVIERLKCINGRWKDWGRFRYITSNAVVEELKNINIDGLKKNR
ncbi:MAG TPA: NUDIX hydrolase [Clostridiaceae bacterium]|nr:NUDIX hydrolase [Clostridiaceae bacterium]